MKNTTTWIIVLVIIVGGGLIFMFSDQNKSLISGEENSVDEKSSSALVVDNISYDFGEIDIFGGKVEKDFILKNEGIDSIVILAGTTSCGCTDGVIDGVTFGMHEGMTRQVVIASGESKILKAIYDPLAHGPNAVGPVTRQLFLKTNSTETPELEIRISADVTKK